jgi:hypothetical protein
MVIYVQLIITKKGHTSPLIFPNRQVAFAECNKKATRKSLFYFYFNLNAFLTAST